MTSQEILQGSFLKFLWYVWVKVLFLPQPTRVQLDIARFLTGGGKRRFIQAFRGVGKTFLTAAYVVWRLWKNPDLKVLIVSANESFATEIATFIKQIIEHDAGDGLWAELRPKMGQRQSVLAFDVGPAKADKSPSVKAVGISGQLTGSRADLIISDDVEVVKNSETEGMREKLKRQVAEYAALLKPNGEIVFLGTPQSEQSIYRDLPSKGYEVRIWPARYPLKEKLANYGGFVAPMLLKDMEENPDLQKAQGSTIGGAPTDTQRFTELDLIERETEYRAAGFMLQFMLDTTLSDAERYPLKLKDLICMDVDPKLAPARVVWSSTPEQAWKDIDNVGFDGDRLYRPMMYAPEYLAYSGSVMHIDPSGRGKDETTYIVTKFLHGFIFVRRWGGFRDGYGEETLKRLAEISKEEEVNLIVTEDNFGDGMFGKLLEPYLARIRPCAIDGFKSTGQKEMRIVDTLAPVMRQHRLVMDATVARADLKGEAVRSGLYQLTHMTTARGALKHDDRVDVLAMAVKHWVEYLNADAKKAEDALKAKADKAWEDKFFASHFVGMPQRGPKGYSRGRGRHTRGR
jgi:hypothetical protein